MTPSHDPLGIIFKTGPTGVGEPCGLPQRHPEQHFHRQAGLYGCAVVVPRRPALAGRCGFPGHDGIEPDSQRASALQCFVIGSQVLGPDGGGIALLMPPSYHAGFTRGIHHPICATQP